MSRRDTLEVLRARRALCPRCGYWPSRHNEAGEDVFDNGACDMTRRQVLDLIEKILKEAR